MERRWYEEAARRRGWKPGNQPQKFIGGRLTGSMATPGRRPARTPCAYRGARKTGQALCYAVVRKVCPVRPGYIERRAKCHEAGSTHLVPSASPWAGLHGTSLALGCLRFAYIAQYVLFHLAALAGRPRVFNQVRLSRLGAQGLQCACTVRSIQYHLHASTLRWQLPTLALRCVSLAQYIYITFKSFSRRSYSERLTNWCIHLMTSSGTATLQ